MPLGLASQDCAAQAAPLTLAPFSPQPPLFRPPQKPEKRPRPGWSLPRSHLQRKPWLGRAGRAAERSSPPPRSNPARPTRQRRQLTAAGGSLRRGRRRRLLPHDGRLDALQHREALPHGRPPLMLFQAGQDLLPCGQKRQGGSPGPPSEPGGAAAPGKRTRRGCPAVPARQRRHGHGRCSGAEGGRWAGPPSRSPARYSQRTLLGVACFRRDMACPPRGGAPAERRAPRHAAPQGAAARPAREPAAARPSPGGRRRPPSPGSTRGVAAAAAADKEPPGGAPAEDGGAAAGAPGSCTGTGRPSGARHAGACLRRRDAAPGWW